MKVIDFHVHLEPVEMLNTGSREMFEHSRRDYDRVQSYVRDPERFLRYLDEQGVERAVIINYISDVLGTEREINDFSARYCQTDPHRLIPFGSVHPLEGVDVEKELRRILDLGIRGIKLHPPHQRYNVNAYREGMTGLETLYSICQQKGAPVMVHTGTSIFPDARNVYADPLPCDDVAVDFPELKLIVAHGGRPMWMSTAFFLIRRHPNVFLDVSSIPPQSLLEYFPKLATVPDKILFGSDWPGPGVPDISRNVERFRQLPLPEEVQQKALYDNAAQLLDGRQPANQTRN